MKRRAKVALKVAGLTVVGLMGVSLWSVSQVDCGVGVDGVRWLPPEAHDITFLKQYVTTMAEFDIEREAFEKWCARRKMPLRELGAEESHMVSRCLPMLEQRGVMPPIAEPNEREGDLRIMEESNKVLGAGDLFYEERWSNGGGYTIGYDTEEERGYYYWAHH